ncbi:helix-turn-helix domain-containing protein, partial [Pseudorhodoplanes sp.]|uniref:helix-turn-helix domain-containing protein n=1 Tax=Pseudorhodoplanes sp. TaxID=1934341 RepID=UPI003D0C0B8A
MTDIPVTGAVLKWAREFRGLTEEEAADRLGLAIDDLRAYEAGEKRPNLTMFENFAAKYRLPQATLFRRTPPQTKSMPSDFRTVEGGSPQFSFDFRVGLSNVRSLLGMFERVAEEDDEFVVPKLPLVSMDQNPEDAGEAERKRLGVTVEQQLEWPKSEAFRRWRSRLEELGVIVFQQKFDVRDCRGFTLYETKFAPCIVVNKADPSEAAKIFT